MELIERYLQAIGRALPNFQRDDILSELRSALYDALEGQGESQPDEAQIVAAIQRMGPPQQVAAAYYPAGQYLVGPALYPVFRLVLAIVFTVVVGVQLLAVLASLVAANTAPMVLGGLGGMINGLFVSFGIVVALFWGLQRLEVHPQAAAAPFDPRSLPALETDPELVGRGQQVFNILINVVALVVLTRFVQQGGFAWPGGGGLFQNPVIERYFPLIALTTLAGIVLDIVLLWRGRWQASTRAASVGVKLFSLGVLGLLLQGHNAWLGAAGRAGLLEGMADLPELLLNGSPIAGMLIFRAGIVFTAFVVVLELMIALYRLARPRQRLIRTGVAELIS